MKSFLLYFDMMDALDALSDSEAGKAMKAVFHYAAENVLPEGLAPDGQMFFTFARHWIDLDKEKYIKKIQARAEAGRKGAQARQERRGYESSDFQNSFRGLNTI